MPPRSAAVRRSKPSPSLAIPAGLTHVGNADKEHDMAKARKAAKKKSAKKSAKRGKKK
ncbi:MAG: hypothetical protein H0V44_13630 [Planctomycetes bacterium]|nr:hypothetical protein [Planctomycetota bacterium]